MKRHLPLNAAQDAGFSAGELRAAGVRAEKMVIGAGVRRQALYDAGQLLEAGYTADELFAAGLCVEVGSIRGSVTGRAEGAQK